MAPRHVIITGAGSGLGAATALRFASDCSHLSLCDIDEEGLGRTLEKLKTCPVEVSANPCDVGNQAELEAFVQSSCERVGRLDVLVNNAGVGLFGTIEEITAEAWRRLFAVDLDSVLFASKAALPWLRKSKGCIVNTGSVSALGGDASLVAYNAAKAAIVNMSKAMSIDFGPDQIRVNVICPGMIATEGAISLLDNPAVAQAYAKMVPLGRTGKPEEVASVTHFLASSDASYINGAVVIIDGGMTAATHQPTLSDFVGG